MMDDVIYRKDAIRVLNAKCKNAFNLTCGEEACECAEYMALRDLPSAQQWIPCSERLPDDGTYLCWEWQGFCYVDSFKNGNWETAEKCYTKCIAWMPLPEPYKEGENG